MTKDDMIMKEDNVFKVRKKHIPYAKVRGVWISKEQWDRLQSMRSKLSHLWTAKPNLSLIKGGKGE